MREIPANGKTPSFLLMPTNLYGKLILYCKVTIVCLGLGGRP